MAKEIDSVEIDGIISKLLSGECNSLLYCLLLTTYKVSFGSLTTFDCSSLVFLNESVSEKNFS